MVLSFTDCHSKCGLDRKSSYAQFKERYSIWRTTWILVI